MRSHGMNPPHSNSHRTAANASRQARAPTRGGVTNTCGGERASNWVCLRKRKCSNDPCGRVCRTRTDLHEKTEIADKYSEPAPDHSTVVFLQSCMTTSYSIATQSHSPVPTLAPSDETST